MTEDVLNPTMQIMSAHAIRDPIITYFEPTVTGPVRTALRCARSASRLAAYRGSWGSTAIPLRTEESFFTKPYWAFSNRGA